MQASYLATQVDIIKSRPVAEEVIKLLDLRDSPVWKERFASAGAAGSFNDWLLADLAASLTVTVGTENRLINIWYLDPDPEIAATVANAFVKSYRQISKQLDQGPAMETAQSAESVLTKLRNNLEEAENKASAYQASKGIMAADERLDVETQHLDELMRQRLGADANLRALASRLHAAEDMASHGVTAGLTPQAPNNDLPLHNLQIALAQKDGEIAQQATLLGERHPQMRQLRAERQKLAEQLTTETKKVVETIRGDWLEARGAAEAAQQAEDEQKRKVVELKRVRDGLQPLLTELGSARANYDKGLAMYSEYAMHSDLNQTNVSVLATAEVPSTPVAPNLVRNVGGALLAGLMLAIAAA
jgi:uncharacterized protein involved in exopolysaccharide biosynthesis